MLSLRMQCSTLHTSIGVCRWKPKDSGHNTCLGNACSVYLPHDTEETPASWQTSGVDVPRHANHITTAGLHCCAVGVVRYITRHTCINTLPLSIRFTIIVNVSHSIHRDYSPPVHFGRTRFSSAPSSRHVRVSVSRGYRFPILLCSSDNQILRSLEERDIFRSILLKIRQFMGLESLEKRETVEIYDSCFSILILFFLISRSSS